MCNLLPSGLGEKRCANAYVDLANLLTWYVGICDTGIAILLGLKFLNESLGGKSEQL